MSQRARIIAFLLAAFALFCAGAHAQPRVYVTDNLKNAADLKDSIIAFRESTTQLRFRPRDEADAAYLDFEVKKPAIQKLNDLRVAYTFSRAKVDAHGFKSCFACEIDSLFREVVDATIFSEPALYPPLPIDDCHADGQVAIIVDVKLVGGVGLERKILYGLRKGTHEPSQLLLASEYAEPWKSTHARLIFANRQRDLWNGLRDTCDLANEKARKSEARLWILVPHKVPPATVGSLNPNGIRATQ